MRVVVFLLPFRSNTFLFLSLCLFLSSSSTHHRNGGGFGSGVLAQPQPQQPHQHQQNGGGIVAGYLTDTSMNDNNNNIVHHLNATAPFLTDIVLVSIHPHSRGNVEGCCLDSNHYELARQARDSSSSQQQQQQQQQQTNIWVTLGGTPGRSDTFPKIIFDDVKRNRLIHGMVRLAKQESISGINIDAHVPQSRMDTFIPFLQEASNVWRNDTGLLVSITLHANQFLPKPEHYDYVDRVHLKAYDMPMTNTGIHHAALENVKKVVQGLIDSQCPRHKIVLGIPAFARLLDRGSHDTHDTHDYEGSPSAPFSNIYDGIFASGFETNGPKDPQAQKLLYALDKHQGLSWDSPQLITIKIRDIVQKEGLGGIYISELGQDKQVATIAAPGGVLLETAAKAMKKIKTNVNGSSSSSSSGGAADNKGEQEL